MKRLVALFCLLVLCFVALAAAQQPKQLTIEAIFAEGGITGRAPETIKWSPDGQKVSFVQRDDAGERGALWYVDVASGKKAVLVAEEKLRSLQPPISGLQDEREKERLTRYSVAGYHWAPDSKHILFDSRGQLWLYSLDDAKAQQLTNSKEAASVPTFSPDGKMLAFVRAHNLFVRDMASGKERQLTKDGSADLLNGEVDWLYAEELDVRSNYFWSPDSKQIVFLQTNEKPVPVYPITDWIGVHPDVDEEKYPKAGDPNPQVRIAVADVASAKVKTVFEPKDAPNTYIPRFGFVKPGLIWAEVLNRAQTHMDLEFVDVASGRARTMLSEDEPQAWVEVTDAPPFYAAGEKFVWSSWRDGHQHLYAYSVPANGPAKLEAQLTKGDYDVTDIDAVDEAGGRVYFTSTQGDARQRQLSSVSLTGGEPQRISREPGTHAANFAPKAAFYVDNYSAALTPPTLALCKNNGQCTPFWQSRTLDHYQLIKPQFLDFVAADGKTKLHGMMYVPNGTAGTKVPLIMNPYGGPGGQVVRDNWVGANGLFDQILVARGFAILKVDNRGMANRGKAFVAATRLKMGEMELADQLAVLDQALKQFPQLDATRVGFWGWSYGGYMTLSAMTHSERFKAGVSVAPVSDWRFYDTTYTERYMGLPKENEAGYKASSPLNFAKNLSGNLLLVHGTSDDNVHLQNTIQMVNALIDAGKPFDLQLYPRKTHGIAGAKARTHLFHRIEQHFEEHLK